MDRVASLILSLLLVLAPIAAMAAPCGGSGCDAGVASEVFAAEASESCCGDDAESSDAAGVLERDAEHGPTPSDRCPSDGDCDCPISCACSGKTLIDRVPERGFTASQPAIVVRAAGSREAYEPAHLDQLKRPPRPFTA